jgi:hypothetical protein
VLTPSPLNKWLIRYLLQLEYWALYRQSPKLNSNNWNGPNPFSSLLKSKSSPSTANGTITSITNSYLKCNKEKEIPFVSRAPMQRNNKTGGEQNCEKERKTLMLLP